MPPRAKLLPVHAPGESKLGDWRIDISRKTSAEMGEHPPRRRREYLPTKGKAEVRCAEVRDAKASASTGAGALNLEQRAEAFRCLKIAAEHGFTLTAAVEEKVVRVQTTRRSILVPALVEEFIAYKKGRDLSPEYLKDMTIVLNRFAHAHPEVLASDLTTVGIKTFLDELPGLKSPVSWNNNRRLISVLLNFALRHDPQYVPANVCLRLEEKPKANKEVEIYTADQARRMLGQAVESARRLVPVLAIALFAGVRPDESRRLTWQRVLWPEKDQAGHLELKAVETKDGKRRLVEIQPNLLAWLEPFRGSTGNIWPLGRHAYYEMMPQMRKDAGVTGVDDGFRHSFASHHLAKFSDLGRTTSDLGHRTTAMLFEHYRSAVTRAEGVAYFDILPTENQTKLLRTSHE